MIVAVPVVLVVEVPRNQVVGVISMRHRRVAAPRAVAVVLRVATAGVRRRARRGIRPIDGDGVLVDVIAVDVMEVTVMKVVDVAVVRDRLMAAVRPVDVIVAGVGGVL